MKTKLIDGLVVRGHDIARGMQCMILGCYDYKVPRSSTGMWLHYFTQWNVTDCDRIVDTVIAVCTSNKD